MALIARAICRDTRNHDYAHVHDLQRRSTCARSVIFQLEHESGQMYSNETHNYYYYDTQRIIDAGQCVVAALPDGKLHRVQEASYFSRLELVATIVSSIDRELPGL